MIETQNLGKKYGEVTAIEGIKLELCSSEVLAVVGPSGCGKTTLLRLIAGLEKPDEGTIRIGGVIASSPSQLTAPHERQLSMIFQDLALWPHMTVKDHLGFVIRNARVSKETIDLKMRGLLEDVNLTGYDNRYPHELSGGERQRLAIARALASKPKYLLMDEPFSNLDPISKGKLQTFISELQNRLKLGIVYVTHNMEEALILANKIAVLYNGRIIQMADKEKLLSHPKNEFVRRFLGIT